jgi:hypothetical protein
VKKRYNNELTQLFGDLDKLSFVGTSRLNRIDHVSRMDTERKVSQIFNNNPQVSRQRGQPKIIWCHCVQTDINKCKSKKLKERQKKQS